MNTTTETDAFVTLVCAACDQPIGKQYKLSPLDSISIPSLVHRQTAPRFVLSRGALTSYVLGSTSSGSNDGAEIHAAIGEAAGIVANAEAALLLPETTARFDALERADGDVRLQLAQLMRVVLSLDQRLRSVEERNGDRAADVGAERSKRPHLG